MLAVWSAPDQAALFLRFLESSLKEAIATGERAVRAAESQSPSDPQQAAGRAANTFDNDRGDFQSPIGTMKRPPWPPRFDDPPAAPSLPANRGPILPPTVTESPSFPEFAAIKNDARPPEAGDVGSPGVAGVYPGTSRLEFPPLPTGIRPVLDPIENSPARLPSAYPQVEMPGGLEATGPPVFQQAPRAPEKPLEMTPKIGGGDLFSAATGEGPGVALPARDSPAQLSEFSAPAGEVMISDQAAFSALSAFRDSAVQVAGFHTQHAAGLDEHLCEQTKVLARVGSDVILAGEILGAVNEVLLPYRDKVPAAVFERYKQQLARQLLEKRIEVKLVYQDIKRKVPAESLQKIEKEIEKFFEEKEVPARLRKMGLASAKEWDERLRSFGSSLEHEKRAFIEGTLARDWMKQQTAAQAARREISPEMLWAYYREHIAEFEQPAEVRWQQLMVKKRPDRSPAEAYAKLAGLGNRVLSGEPFEEVARSGSEGPTASEGGLREPVQPGSLRSRVLEEALFTLPVGQLSPILEDEQGFHIVRVLERRDARRIPFTEAQVQIRERLAQEEREKQITEYLQKLRREIPVWNSLEVGMQEDGQAATPLSSRGSLIPR